MSNQTTKEFNEQFSEINKDENFEKMISQNSKNQVYLYGMTLEQYQEGMEIHSKCFNQLEKIIQKRMN